MATQTSNEIKTKEGVIEAKDLSKVALEFPGLITHMEKLKGEIGKLKRQLFWRDYGTKQIREAFAHFNTGVTYCNCINCQVGGRTRSPGMDECHKNTDTFNCLWQAPVEAKMKELGITFRFDEGTDPIEDPDLSKEEGSHPLSGENVHFGLAPRCDWVDFHLGRKLWGSKDPNKDVECKKLVSLVDWLYSAE